MNLDCYIKIEDILKTETILVVFKFARMISQVITGITDHKQFSVAARGAWMGLTEWQIKVIIIFYWLMNWSLIF